MYAATHASDSTGPSNVAANDMLWRAENAAVSAVSCPCYSCLVPPVRNGTGGLSPRRWPNARPKAGHFVEAAESGSAPVKVHHRVTGSVEPGT